VKSFARLVFLPTNSQTSSAILLSSVSTFSIPVLYFLIDGALSGLVSPLSLNFNLNSDVDGLRLALLCGLIFLLLKGLIILDTEWAKDFADWTRLALTEMLCRTLYKLLDF
jgi:hypothetical protein